MPVEPTVQPTPTDIVWGAKAIGVRRDALTAYRQTLDDGAAVDLALDVEARIDALDCFEGERCDDGELATRLGGHVGEEEELASSVRPAAGLGDRPRLAASLVEPIETRVSIGLQNAGITEHV
jgi:hypothetical protein